MPEAPAPHSTPKPPLRCPACGSELSALAKSWNRYKNAMAEVVRYPIAYAAEYHCGAKITARLHSSHGFRSSAGYSPMNERWQVDVDAGCASALRKALGDG